MVTEQHCSDCIYFENITQEDWFNGDYHMWSDISCSMGNEIEDTWAGFQPFHKPCEDYEEKNYE